MSLSAGTRLGSYDILALLGAGGMGEVYRARDTKLGRDVALKILPELFAADADRLARFQREAQVLASLNHSHIGHIYGLEESNDVRALVLELVEGPTLADRISCGPIPLEEALPIARQIAEALEAAHEQGIVHRDLKPANIKVRDDGTVKVLDFGLAKALESDAAHRPVNVTASPTLSMPAMTQMGVILGTAAYMSPEQAHGRSADRRADIFSFGAVLFEMLSGKQAFTGESVGETLASVLKVDPDRGQLPPATPAAIRRLLDRCLTKDPKRRLQAIGEARILLEQPVLDEAGSTARPEPSRLAYAWPILTAVTAVVAGVALWGWLRPSPIDPRPVLRFEQTLDVANVIGSLALSRDGSRLAYVSGPERTIHVRTMDGGEARSIPGTENATNLCFSPEGQSISFMGMGRGGSGRQLKKVAVTGGTVQALASALGVVVGPATPCWADDGYIYFSSDGALQRISSEGGQPETLASPDPKNNERAYFSPQLLPGGADVLVSITATSGAIAERIVAVNLKTGARKVLLDRGGMARYVPSRNGSGSGHLLLHDAASGSLLAVPFDARQLQLQGPLVPVVEGIQSAVGPFGMFAVSDAGILAYAPGAAFSNRTLVWVDRQGQEESTSSPVHQYNLPRLSPNGTLAAVEIQGPSASQSNIAMYDLVRKVLAPVTTEDFNVSPVWTPDGKRLLYASSRDKSQRAIVSVPSDRSGPPSRVGGDATSNSLLVPHSVSPDGTIIGVDSGTGPSAAWTLSLSAPSTEKPAAFLDSRSRKPAVVFSPDGHWVAYAASVRDNARRTEIHVTAYPRPGPHVQISTEGGALPRWRSDGRELFYRSGDKMMAVDIELGAEVRAGLPRELFEKSYGNGFDVAPDGKRFLMIKLSSAVPSNQVTFVVNWFEELKARVPAK